MRKPIMTVAVSRNDTPDAKEQRSVVDLTRTTPPAPSFLGDEVRHALNQLSRKTTLTELIRNHRFGGTQDDREAGSLWLSQRLGESPAPDRILVTNGTQNAILLLLAHVVKPGGVLLTEALTYHGVRVIAKTLGIEIRGVAMDHDGLIPDAFASACRDTGAAAIYCMPTLQNPTAITMSERRRHEIAEIARASHVKIIEDDVYGLLFKQAPAPFGAIAPDVTWHVTGFGKVVAAGVRIGYALAPSAAEATDLLDQFRTMSTWFAAPLQAALASIWIRQGAARRILEAIRSEAAKRQALARTILGPDQDIQPHALHVWLPLPPYWDADQFVRAARDEGVIIRPGHLFAVTSEIAPNYVRVCTGSPMTKAELNVGLSTLVKLLADQSRAAA
jgi:DNA-binding transcriptional MocR family regulator